MHADQPRVVVGCRLFEIQNVEKKKKKKKHGEIERRELEYSIGRRLALKIDM